jgi:hypothetical protein
MNNSTFDRYLIKLQYAVGGKDYFYNTSWFETNLPGASAFVAYYDPQNPNKVYLAKDLRDSWIPFTIGGLFSVIAIVLYCAIAGWF